MQPIRAQIFGSLPARKPVARDRKPQNVQASLNNARDLSTQVHRWYLAARHHLAQAHRFDQQIVTLQGRADTLEKTLGRASPIMLGAGAPLLGFGEMLHTTVVSQGAMGLLAAGLIGSLAWVGGIAGIKRRITRLSRQCAEAQDQIQNYTRLAEALDPERYAVAAPAGAATRMMRGLQAPRSRR